MGSDVNAHAIAEQTARESYGRLVAYLASRTRSLAAAEDALSEAFASALTQWPERGIPQNPEAWLLSVAKRRIVDGVRHRLVVENAEATLTTAAEEARDALNARSELPDRRLELLFVCAHPRISQKARTPLMLQVVLGLDARRMAPTFMIPPSTLSQRLVRAKRRIQEEDISFGIPPREEWPDRLGAVLEAVYAAYSAGWDELTGSDLKRRRLAGEGLWLAQLLSHMLPDEPEARGLFALVLFLESRRAARRDEQGAYVPLSEQDTDLWDSRLLKEANLQMTRAAQRAGLYGDSDEGAPLSRVGPYQLEAAIQAVHAQRKLTGHTDWLAIAELYDTLHHISPTLGAAVGRAAAHGKAFGESTGLARLDAIPVNRVGAYQPYWAVRAGLLAGLRRIPEADDAYERAIGLSADPAVREFLHSERRTMLS